MSNPDQIMSRKELLAAGNRVSAQIERLNYMGGAQMSAGDSDLKTKTIDELRAILDEINAELAEMDAKRA